MRHFKLKNPQVKNGFKIVSERKFNLMLRELLRYADEHFKNYSDSQKSEMFNVCRRLLNSYVLEIMN